MGALCRWNAHTRVTILSFIVLFLKGESNTYNYESYGCAVQQMVEDWRASWFANTPTMDEQFPFGEVQVHVLISEATHG